MDEIIMTDEIAVHICINILKFVTYLFDYFTDVDSF